jgi:hypothetical protein
MSENLNKKPPKGILKQSSSFDTNSKGSNAFATPRCSITSLQGGGGGGFEMGTSATVLAEDIAEQQQQQQADDELAPISPNIRKSSYVTNTN